MLAFVYHLPMWYVYLVQCSDESLYCGITTDITRRIYEHNGKGNRGARYTRAHRPVTLKWYEEYLDRSSAAKREYAIKRLNHQQKMQLSQKICGSCKTDNVT